VPPTDDLIPKDELATRLRSAFTRDGQWNWEALATYGAGFWRAWIDARLRHEDPWVPYERDEFPRAAAGLFVDYAEQARKAYEDTAACEEGTAQFLASLNWEPSGGEPAHLLKNAIYLVGKLRARRDESLAVLRNVITEKKLLARSDWPIELHRSALFTLAALQKRGDLDDLPIWRKWLEPCEPHKYAFIPAAFSGLAMSCPHVPDEDLRTLLELYPEAQASGDRMRITPAILALWIDREAESDRVREEVWRAVQESPHPEGNWEIIRKCADRAWPGVRSFGEMARLISTLPGPRLEQPVALWGPDVALRPAQAG